ncbi:MAG: hypothetical protein IKV74_03960 [Clostridia bacterium]|nr:hypothetical protein [Clostridia bacterium]
MKKKWLGITLALLVVVVAAVAAVITLGDTKAEAADYPIVITTSKTEFMAGEGITVDISGLTESMRGHILDFRLEKGFVYEEDGPAFSNRNNYKAISYLNIGKDARDEMAEPYANTSETRTVTFSDGMRVHPTRETDGYATIVPGTYTLWVLDFTTNKVVSNRIYLTVCATMISSNKTQYAYGEPIVVSHTGLPKEYFWGDGNNGDSELLIYAENDWYRAAKSESYNSCLVVGTGSGSQMYVELGKGNGSNGFTAEDYASGSVPAGSFTFPNVVDGGKFSSMIQVMPGKYRIVATYRTAAGSYLTNASNVIEIEILAPEISISKTDLGYGEDATVTWSNVHESLRGTGYVEIGIFKKGDVVGTDRNLKYFAVHNASVNKGLNGSFSLNNDMVGAVLTATAPIQPGEYFLALRTSYKAVGSNNTCTVGTAIVNFTVHSPEIQLAKDTFAYGEGITLTYKYCTEQWLLDNKNQSYLSIDVFHKGYGQAANADKGIAARQTEQEHVIFHVTPTVTQSNLTEATITFPYDDNDKKAQRFPFEPGEYRVIVRLGGKQLNETECTFTVEEPVFKIQPELNDSISMHFSVLMGDDIFGIDTLVRNPMLKISFNNDVVENRNYTKELDSETGLYWYTFTYDNVLPQQMMDFFAAELFIEGPVFDYTKFANANSVSVRKISNYSIRIFLR